MKRGFVVAVAGVAIVVAGLAGCSSSKQDVGKGSAKVTIDGKEQTISGTIQCVTAANKVTIQLGNLSDDPTNTLQAVVTTDDPPKVDAVQLGKVDGQTLQVAPPMGDATATKDGKNYKIKGNTMSGGIDMSNPMAPKPQTKPFDIDVTCP